jgi:large subunit ribosomal protein L13
MEKKVYKIDATGEKLGRIASKIANILNGKNLTSFAKNVVANVTVEVSNASKLDMSEKRIDQKVYTSYSGYPGGLIEKKMSDVIAKKGFSDVLRRAVYRMLPNNKLRSKRIINLKIKE